MIQTNLYRPSQPLHCIKLAVATAKTSNSQICFVGEESFDEFVNEFHCSSHLEVYLEKLQPDLLQVTIPLCLWDDFVYAAMLYNF